MRLSLALLSSPVLMLTSLATLHCSLRSSPFARHPPYTSFAHSLARESLLPRPILDPLQIQPKGRPRTVRLKPAYEGKSGGKRRRLIGVEMEDSVALPPSSLPGQRSRRERAGTRTCGNCGGKGHNRRTCSKRRRDGEEEGGKRSWEKEESGEGAPREGKGNGRMGDH